MQYDAYLLASRRRFGALCLGQGLGGDDEDHLKNQPKVLAVQRLLVIRLTLDDLLDNLEQLCDKLFLRAIAVAFLEGVQLLGRLQDM